MRNFKVNNEYDDLRLDRFLKKVCPSLTQGVIEKWCRLGLVSLNGEKIKKAGCRVFSNQSIEVPDFKDIKKNIKKEIYELTNEDKNFIRSLIIEENEDCWALDKPSGLAVQGGSNTFNYLDKLLPGLVSSPDQDPKIVHRLDKDTSGVLLIAKNYKSAKFLTKLFKERLIKKTYYGVVIGKPKKESGEINVPICKVSRDGMEKMEVNYNSGLNSVTKYNIEKHLGNNLYLLKFIPLTGRKHQIRVHSAYIGCPILGDVKYGTNKNNSLMKNKRLMLHSYSVEFKDKNNNNFFVKSDFTKILNKIITIN